MITVSGFYFTAKLKIDDPKFGGLLFGVLLFSALSLGIDDSVDFW